MFRGPIGARFYHSIDPVKTFLELAKKLLSGVLIRSGLYYQSLPFLGQIPIRKCNSKQKRISEELHALGGLVEWWSAPAQSSEREWIFFLKAPHFRNC